MCTTPNIFKSANELAAPLINILILLILLLIIIYCIEFELVNFQYYSFFYEKNAN